MRRMPQLTCTNTFNFGLRPQWMVCFGSCTCFHLKWRTPIIIWVQILGHVAFWGYLHLSLYELREHSEKSTGKSSCSQGETAIWSISIFRHSNSFFSEYPAKCPHSISTNSYALEKKQAISSIILCSYMFISFISHELSKALPHSKHYIRNYPPKRFLKGSINTIFGCYVLVKQCHKTTHS